MQAVGPSGNPADDRHRLSRDDLPDVPTSGPVVDGTRIVSAIAGALTAGATLGGPLGAVIGGLLGAGLGALVTVRQHRHD